MPTWGRSCSPKQRAGKGHGSLFDSETVRVAGPRAAYLTRTGSFDKNATYYLTTTQAVEPNPLFLGRFSVLQPVSCAELGCHRLGDKSVRDLVSVGQNVWELLLETLQHTCQGFSNRRSCSRKTLSAREALMAAPCEGARLR